MESPNAPPAHDFFTPAWLKLPDPQISKKNGSSVSPSQSSFASENQTRRYSNGFSSSQRKDSSSVNSINSFANGSVDSRFNTAPHDSSSYLNSRHNSFGSEQQFSKPNPHSTSNVNGRPKKLIESGSRSPFRSGFRDKYHSNFKGNKNVDTFKTDFNSSSRKFNSKSSDDLDNESYEKNASTEENCNVFNQEFPSLVNINGENGPNDNSSVQSAWTNPQTKSKVLSTSKNCQLINTAVNNFDNSDAGNRSETNGTSKVLMSSVMLRNSLIGKKSGGILKENYHSRIQPVLTKTTAQTTHSMEILFKNPKRKSNKDFLKSIQNDQNEDKGSDKDIQHSEEKLEKLEITADNRNVEPKPSKTGSAQKYSMGYENDLNNALNINSLLRRQPEPCNDPVLSSSLEAEHRLLMELGWKAEPDDDDPSYAPLTEDEVKEFYARNGFKPVERKATHVMPRPPGPTFQDSDDLEDESSSSSDDD